MKAVIWTRYGPPEVLALRDLPDPRPKDHEVRIRLYASTVTKGDCEMQALAFPIYLGLPLRIWI
jgi:NADPH:quinone reductase-like Zn-dependent oxidoreductase